jgi:hypothetical protein
VFRSTCGDYRVLPTHCTRAAGAAGTRRFLRPLFSLGECFVHDSDALRREDAKVYLEFHVIASQRSHKILAP